MNRELARVCVVPGLPGWERSSGRIGSDPYLELRRAGFTIRLQLLGGEPSRHPDPGAFLASPEAKDARGAPVIERGRVLAAGRLRPLYSRRYPVELSDPRGGASGHREEVAEEFAVIRPKTGPSFLLATLSARGPAAPDLEPAREDWRAFLRGLRFTAGSP